MKRNKMANLQSLIDLFVEEGLITEVIRFGKFIEGMHDIEDILDRLTPHSHFLAYNGFSFLDTRYLELEIEEAIIDGCGIYVFKKHDVYDVSSDLDKQIRHDVNSLIEFIIKRGDKITQRPTTSFFHIYYSSDCFEISVKDRTEELNGLQINESILSGGNYIFKLDELRQYLLQRFP